MITINPDIPPARRAYTLDGGPVGVLMLHGFMGSPASSRPMAEYLNEAGITVHCPLLPGHGHMPERLHKVSHRQWLHTAEQGFRDIQERCSEMFVIGHSMGAVLSAHLAARSADFRGQILLAPIYSVPTRKIYAMAALRYVMPWYYPLKHSSIDHEIVYGRVKDFDPTIDVDDPEVKEWLLDGTRLPTSALDELRKMIHIGRKLWGRLTLPTVIFQGGDDPAVTPETTRLIHARLKSEEKKMFYLPDGSHELMRPYDAAHMEVWPRIRDFIYEHSAYLSAEKEAVTSH